jgi:protocatechuate 3,4-dioxygenase beta subunit
MLYTQYQVCKNGVRQPTPVDIEGPFYKKGAPKITQLSENPTLTLHIQVYNTDGEIVPNATVDFWQADEQGNYDNEGFKLRGKWVSTPEGFDLKTIMPGDYQIGEHEFRCAHLHFKISAAGHKSLTTQLYFPDDKYNATDHWFDPRRVVQPPNANFEFVIEKLTKK